MTQLTVDRDLCIGCCRCVDYAPATFSMEGGLAFVKSQPTEAHELAEANGAIESCPAEAIFWEDENVAR